MNYGFDKQNQMNHCLHQQSAVILNVSVGSERLTLNSDPHALHSEPEDTDLHLSFLSLLPASSHHFLTLSLLVLPPVGHVPA